MASSAPHQPQNQTLDQTRVLKHCGPNKVSEHLRTNTAQTYNRGTENQDPNQLANPAKGVSKLKGVSRLPVLAKSLQSFSTDSQTPGYKRWEEKPLMCKAQKKKLCTKPVPFSLSQSRIHSQKKSESLENASRSGTPSAHPPRLTPGKTLSISQHRTKAGTTSASADTQAKHFSNTVTKTVQPALQGLTIAQAQLKSTNSVLKTGSNPSSHGIGSTVQRDLSTQLCSVKITPSKVTKVPSHSFRTGVVDDKADVQPENLPSAACISTADVCGSLQSDGVTSAVTQSLTPRLSTCPSGSASSVYLPQRVSVKKKIHRADAASGVGVTFSPDASALRSILLNEGVKVVGPVGATPRDSTFPSRRGTSIYSAQRVPMQKPQWQATVQTGGAVSFSPDPSALRSILLNEGVKVGGPAGATPRVSVCPSGRGTSIYSAQRVPVKKSQTETATDVPGAAGGAVSFSPDPSALCSILLNEGVKVGATPRVSVCPSGRGTSIYSAQRVPLRKTRADATTTEAIQSGVSRTPAMKHTPQRVPYSHSQSVRRLISAHKTLIFRDSPALGSTEQEEDVVQRLFQEEPEQESSEKMEEDVDDVTSTQTQEHQQTLEGDTDKDQNLQPDAESSTQSHSAQTREPHIMPDTDEDKQMLPSTLYKPKSSSLSSTVCVLRRCLPALDEMLLDDECATYTSTQQSWPMPLRCSNPVASMLHFQDSICFMPINLTSSDLSPSSSFSSPTRA